MLGCSFFSAAGSRAQSHRLLDPALSAADSSINNSKTGYPVHTSCFRKSRIRSICARHIGPEHMGQILVWQIVCADRVAHAKFRLKCLGSICHVWGSAQPHYAL